MSCSEVYCKLTIIDTFEKAVYASNMVSAMYTKYQ